MRNYVLASVLIAALAPLSVFAQLNRVYYTEFAEVDEHEVLNDWNNVNIYDGLSLSHFSETGASMTTKVLPIDYVHDFRVEAQINMEGENPETFYGLIFGRMGTHLHLAHESKGWFFMLNQKGEYLFALEDGLGLTELAREKAKGVFDKKESSYELAVERKGGKMFFYINQTQIFIHEGSFTPYGMRAGLAIYGGEGLLTSNKFALYSTDEQLNHKMEQLTISRERGIDLVELALDDIKKENLKILNSEMDELYPHISPDGTLLNYIKKNDDGSESYLYSEMKNDQWTTPGSFAEALHVDPGEYSCNFTPDKNTLLINAKWVDKKFVKPGLSVINRTKTGWSDPVNLKIKNIDKYDHGRSTSAFLAADGKTLIMALDPDHSYKDHIYVSFLLKDGTWSEPKNLGSTINSKNSKSSYPLMGADGVTMYYTTNMYPGYGHLDWVVTKRLDKTWQKWSKPKNLGPNFNSPGEEMNFAIDATGDFAIVGYKDPKTEHFDLYKTSLPDAAKPEPVKLIKGNVTNYKTGKPIASKVTVRQMRDDHEFGQAHTRELDGFYEVVVPHDKKYAIYAEYNEDFYSVRQMVSAPGIKKYSEEDRDLTVIPLDSGAQIPLNNVFFNDKGYDLLETSTEELDNLVILLKHHPNVNMELRSFTNGWGGSSGDQKNLELAQNRANKLQIYLQDRGVRPERLKSVGIPEPDFMMNDIPQGTKLREASDLIVSVVKKKAE